MFVTNAHPKLNISITKHSKRSNHSNHNIQIIRSTLQLKPTNSLTDSLTVVWNLRRIALTLFTSVLFHRNFLNWFSHVSIQNSYTRRCATRCCARYRRLGSSNVFIAYNLTKDLNDFAMSWSCLHGTKICIIHWFVKISQQFFEPK